MKSNEQDSNQETIPMANRPTPNPLHVLDPDHVRQWLWECPPLTELFDRLAANPECDIPREAFLDFGASIVWLIGQTSQWAESHTEGYDAHILLCVLDAHHVTLQPFPPDVTAVVSEQEMQEILDIDIYFFADGSLLEQSTKECRLTTDGLARLPHLHADVAAEREARRQRGSGWPSVPPGIPVRK